MQASQIPTKISVPWGNDAGSGYIRTVPVASQIGIQNGAASYTDGFPPLCFLPVGAGGVPPFGQDMNGVLNQVTLWDQWQAAGGLPTYDSGFSSAVGGYPKGAVLASSSTAGLVWLNTSDNNTTNPDSSGTGWLPVITGSGLQSGSYVSYTDSGAADALVITPSPAISAYAKYQRFYVQVAHNNATTTPTININGLGAKTIVWGDGSALAANDLQASMMTVLEYDGTSFRILSGGGPTLWQRAAPSGSSTNKAPKLIGCTVSGTTAIPESSNTLLSMSVAQNNLYGTSTFSSNTLTVGAGEAGIWAISAYLWFNSGTISSSQYMSVGIFQNGAQQLLGTCVTLSGTGSVANISGTLRLAAGDTVQFFGFQQIVSPSATSAGNGASMYLISAY